MPQRQHSFSSSHMLSLGEEQNSSCLQDTCNAPVVLSKHDSSGSDASDTMGDTTEVNHDVDVIYHLDNDLMDHTSFSASSSCSSYSCTTEDEEEEEEDEEEEEEDDEDDSDSDDDGSDSDDDSCISLLESVGREMASDLSLKSLACGSRSAASISPLPTTTTTTTRRAAPTVRKSRSNNPRKLHRRRSSMPCLPTPSSTSMMDSSCSSLTSIGIDLQDDEYHGDNVVMTDESLKSIMSRMQACQDVYFQDPQYSKPITPSSSSTSLATLAARQHQRQRQRQHRLSASLNDLRYNNQDDTTTSCRDDDGDDDLWEALSMDEDCDNDDEKPARSAAPDTPMEVLNRLLVDVSSAVEHLADNNTTTTTTATASTTSTSSTSSTTSQEYWQEYFLPISSDRIQAYEDNQVVVQAIRAQNLALLQELHQTSHAGINWNACNSQGESLVHLACRRHNVPLLTFLIEDCQASLAVRDDWGKTPLHELCWNSPPRDHHHCSNNNNSISFQAVKLLVARAPHLLFAQDKRGFSPLQYIPQEAHRDWVEWLQSKRLFLRCQVQYIGYAHARDKLNHTMQRALQVLNGHK